MRVHADHTFSPGMALKRAVQAAFKALVEVLPPIPQSLQTIMLLKQAWCLRMLEMRHRHDEGMRPVCVRVPSSRPASSTVRLHTMMLYV